MTFCDVNLTKTYKKWNFRSGISCLRQMFVVFLINIPAFSFGLSIGWVSGVSSGEAGDDDITATATVLGAAGTFVVVAVGAPLFTNLVTWTSPRLALMSTSVLFAVCWTIKLCSNNDVAVIVARGVAGLGGAGAWALSPIFATEICEVQWRGAASGAVGVAHQLGLLVSYACTAGGASRHVVEGLAIVFALLHCCIHPLVPEFPAYLALQGRHLDAIKSLSWLRCRNPEDPALAAELKELPAPTAQVSQIKDIKQIFSDSSIRRTFLKVLVCVVAQEMCGILALMHYAERIFKMAEESSGRTILTPAHQAVLLGVAQLLGSVLLVYVVEKAGRKKLLLWTSAAVTLSVLGACICISIDGAAIAAPVLLVFAAFADSAGVQSVPYVILSESLSGSLKNAASGIIGVGGGFINAVELLVFPVLVAYGGLRTALGTSVVLMGMYTSFVFLMLPETKGLTVEEIQILFNSNSNKVSNSKSCKSVTCDIDYITKL